jgi:hypothetical protein
VSTLWDSAAADAIGWWLTGSNIVMIWPSTSMTCGTYMSCRTPARSLGEDVLPLPGAP